MGRFRRHLAAVVLGVGIFGAPGFASGEGPGVEAGLLTCTGEGGTGFIIGSQKQLVCRFERGKGRVVEFYDATITKLGIDIGTTGETEIIWTVLAATTDLGEGALRGNYVGASVDASVGVGAGVNVLVGGLQRSITLQPFSVQGQTGLNVALGVSGLTLR
ncbi:MAG: DUF992 domain-containing protein [Rhizobiales bacterium]|nr:DUF992 domain-containing protein [Hyphomicrobiales bacterium]